MTTAPIKSLAGRALATGEATESEIRSLAAYVAGDADNARVAAPIQPTRTKVELVRLLSSIEGKEGQHERRLAIQAQLDALA